MKKIVIGSMEYNYPTTVKVIADKTKCYIDEGFCFTTGTPVLMATGTTMAIEQVQPGDTIETYNHTAKHNTPGIVKRAWARTTSKLCRLVIGGAMLLSTPEHPLFANNGYIQAKDLQYGDSVLTASGNYDKVESVALFDSTATVYNLEVARQQNYYAGSKQLLVHNNCAWLTIREAMNEAKAEELFRTFSNSLISGKFSALQRKNLYDAIAQLGTNKKAFLADFAANPDMLKAFVENPKLVESWKLLSDAGVPNLSNKLDDIEFVGKYIDEIKGAGGYKAWRDIAIQADNVSAFSNLTYAQKLENIKNIWNTKYPIEDMLGGRSFFEDIMGEYRYTKTSGWNHTGDISFNVKGIDFYKGTQQGSEIYASTAVSMKTTIKTNIDEWLKYTSVQDNIKFLKEGLTPSGLIDPNNNLKMFMTNAEIHIYMPKANITESLKASWMNKLNTIDPKIKFEIKALEDFIQ